MKYSTLTQSKYFNPAFNSAIFDGPIRIYFAQPHEGMALKLYFLLQNHFSEEIGKAKRIFKKKGKNILVMMYPTADTFCLSFDGTPSTLPLAVDSLGEDSVIGLRGPLDETKYDLLFHTIIEIIHKWDMSMGGDRVIASLPL